MKYMKFVTATPSFTCAFFVFSISTGFFWDFHMEVGSISSRIRTESGSSLIVA